MPKQNGLLITGIGRGSLAEGAGISPGDVLLEINGEKVLDSLNYHFLASQRDCTEALVIKPNGDTIKALLENGGDALGIELAQDTIKVCKQNCVFCFVSQMPKGFRKSLYLKDEDIRLSFLYGQFTTLSNSQDDELARIIRERLSPIHVSVHATDLAVRRRVVGNPKDGDILGKIDRLISGGIEMHTQAVIAPGYSDGEIWERTLKDLWKRRADHKGKGGVLSLSCVPVGLTAHRENLPFIREIDQVYAESWAKRWKWEAPRYALPDGEPWLLLADEWFTRAGIRVPGRKFYSANWNQIENGVGLVRHFLEHSRRFIKSDRAKGFKGKRLLLLTGTSFAPYLLKECEKLNTQAGCHIRVAAVPNAAFGHSVTVAGLLCGRDLLATAKEHMASKREAMVDAVIVPGSSMRPADGPRHGPQSTLGENDGIFLDDMTLAEMQSELKAPVVSGGENLSQMLANINLAAI
jgi:putative radical SAM enzyme (TIGR03279 family)